MILKKIVNLWDESRVGLKSRADWGLIAQIESGKIIYMK